MPKAWSLMRFWNESRATQADAKEAAICNLRSDLMELGYSESEIQWHAARRGRRVKCLYVAGATIPNEMASSNA
jgi:hypothetical protein